MRTITTQKTVYTFAELPPEGKEKAKERWAQHDYFPQGQEALDSLKAFAEHFNSRLYDYEVDYTASSYSSAKFNTPDDGMTESEIKSRLKALGAYNKKTLRGNGECKLTGVCYDESAIDGFRIAFMKDGERDLEKLLQAGFDTWLKDVQSEYEYQYTDEAFQEMCEANGYEFTAEGALV